jgi:hypothetical protein
MDSLQGYVGGRLDLTELALANSERGFRDAADLVAPVRASLHGPDDTEFEVGETDD